MDTALVIITSTTLVLTVAVTTTAVIFALKARREVKRLTEKSNRLQALLKNFTTALLDI